MVSLPVRKVNRASTNSQSPSWRRMPRLAIAGMLTLPGVCIVAGLLFIISSGTPSATRQAVDISDFPIYAVAIAVEMRGSRPTPNPQSNANPSLMNFGGVQSLQYSVTANKTTVAGFYDHWLASKGWKHSMNTGPNWYERTLTDTATTFRFDIRNILSGANPLLIQTWHEEERYILNVAAGPDNQARPPFVLMTRDTMTLTSHHQG